MSVVIDGVEFVPLAEKEAVQAQLDIWRRAASIAHAHLVVNRDEYKALAALTRETGLTPGDARAMAGLIQEFSRPK